MTRRLALLTAAVAFAAFAQQAGVVSGRVTSALHGEAIAGATVMLRGLDEGAAQTYICETASDGRFSIANVAPGSYDARPSKTGYEQRLPGRAPTAADFPPVIVEAGKAPAPLELHMIPDGVIAGRVLDDDGDPLRHASVEAQQYMYAGGAGGKKQLRTIRNSQTDDHGQYRLFHLAPGRYWLHVVPQPRPFAGRVMGGPQREAVPQSGLAPAFYPGRPDTAHATELQLAPGMEMDGIDIRLTEERLYSIRGRFVMNGPNERVSVYAQSLSPENGRRNGFQTQMFNGDQFEISGVPPGRYAIIAQQFTAAPLQQRSNQTQFGRQTVEIVDRDVDHVELSLEPGVNLKGVITAEGQASVKDALNVNLIPDDPDAMMFGGGARTSPDGTFTLQSPPGVYRVAVNGRQVYLKTVLVGKEALPDRKIDTAHLSGDLTLVIASDYGKLDGTVVDDAGKPAFNANVTLIPDQRRDDWQERFRSTLTRADGKFSIAAVEPGEYKIYAWLDAEPGAAQDPEFRKPFEERAVIVKMDGNGHQTLGLKAIQAR